ncbi:MAG: protein translocase subunit SecD [Eubacterium sp.]|nr:protein translocase subunit SecD [Eubacterium sp.]
MKKGKGIAIVCIILACILGLGYFASIILSPTGRGENQNIILGLDLAGGVSITYEIMEKDATAEEISDTVYKLQRRVEDYSTEATVSKEGSDRINVAIPGVTDANEILEELGTPGSLEFQDPEGNVVLTGDDIVDAQPSYENDNGTQRPVVELTFTDEAAVTFEELTGNNIGKVVPIVYDGEVISSPQVNSKITGGKAVIQGQESYQEAEILASQIRIGSLSLELQELSSQVVGASLGEEAISSALLAAAIGLALIIVFLIAFYWIAGIATTLGLLVYATGVVAVIYLFEITLTLPGIAGIILGIGMAVDANVVINARIKEELMQGKSTGAAIKTGYQKALSAIIDGNVTTLIAAAVLAMKGSGTVKGFAYTLAIGILLSMFTALVVTRYSMYAIHAIGFKDVKYYGAAKEHKTIHFISKRYVFFAVSIAIIAAGFIGEGVNSARGKGAFNYSLEFVGGTSTTVDLGKNYELAEIDSEIVPLIRDALGTAEVQVQKIADTTQVIFKTRNLELEERKKFAQIFTENYSVKQDAISYQNVSETISKEMTSDAVWAVVIAVVLMLIYIWFRFSDFRFASSAIIALVHDILVVITCYALVRISVGSTFIAVMLTILGYSINDTIVTFDRIRENMKSRAKVTQDELKEIADRSITQTLSRSINTSITTFVMVLLLYILGVASIREFSLPLMVGIVSGTYSSICTATELWFEMKIRQRSSKAQNTKGTKKKVKKTA